MSIELLIKERFSAQSVLQVTDQERDGILKLVLDRSYEEVDQNIQAIKDWLKTEPHLPDDDDKQFLLTIFVFNKLSIERTKEKLDAIYSIRNIIPELYVNNEPLHPNMQKVMASNVFLPLPKLNKDFGRIMLMKSFIGSTELDAVANFQYLLIVMELRLLYDMTLHDHIIADFSGTTFSHITKLLPATSLKCLQYLKNTFPNSIKSVHCINVPPFAQNFINLIKSILIKKLIERIHVHSDLDSLHKHINKELLPREYGGNGKSLLEYKEDWHKFMESQNDLVIQRTKIRSNEKLRIGKLTNFNMFGPEGSFRQINVD
ncbi:uncharacterized protein CBL_02404 [Carabus blaptoides fortunei]